MADRDELRRLLHERNEHPELLTEIDRAIRDRFTRTLAVLVLDMSGFSRLTHRYGVVHFLAMIQRMHDLVLPVVEAPRYGGRLLKLEADNVYAVFPDAPRRGERRPLQRQHRHAGRRPRRPERRRPVPAPLRRARARRRGDRGGVGRRRRRP